MKKPSPKVVFFGSGPLAATSLELLVKNFDVESVITKPRPSHHRGNMPVIETAAKFNLKTHIPANKNELNDLFKQVSFQSSVGIVIDYGIIIPEQVINYFEHGIINSHFSILPLLRGPDPITFSILSGQKETGVSLMSIVPAMDEGPILASQKLVIQANDDSRSLTKKLIRLSDDLLSRCLPNYIEGKIKLSAQKGTPTYSRKLTKADGLVDWDKPAEVLEREVRAFVEWPKSRATIGSQLVILKKTAVTNTSGAPGDYNTTNNKLIIYCGENALNIERIQPVNKKEMPVAAFLKGYKL